MIIFLLICFLVTVPGMRPVRPGQLNPDYISKNQTAAINGLFTLFVFLSHAASYIKLDGNLDSPYTAFKRYMLQAVVIPFLFYSGYGIMEAIKKNGKAYVKQIPVSRFLKVLVHFDIAVVLYLILHFALGRTFSAQRIFLALTAYSAVGNSNWYIFAVLGLYLITFIAFMLSGKSRLVGVILTTALSIAFVYLQMRLKRDTWCYDTIILFPAGMIFSMLKPKLEKLLTGHDLIYLCTFALTAAIYWVFYKRRGDGIEFYSTWGILFMALIVLFTMKMKIGNRALNFFGSHVFSIYILQRIPMIVLTRVGLAESHKYIFVIVCFISTIILAVIFDLLMKKLDSKLFRKRIKKSV